MNNNSDVAKSTVAKSVGCDSVGTPSSNTGYNSQDNAYEIAIDWLDFSWREVSGSCEAERLIAAIAAVTHEQIDFSPTRPSFNGRSWSGSGRGSAGTMIWYSAARDSDDVMLLDGLGQYVGYEDVLPPRYSPIDAAALSAIKDKVPDHLTLVFDEKSRFVEFDHGFRLVLNNKSLEQHAILKVAMSASVLARVDMCDLHRLLACRSDVRFSRIDVALDDMSRFVEMHHVKEAARKGDYFDARWRGIIESGERGGDVGMTVYFGSPSSDKRLRVYDKTVESKGVRDCIRWELELRRKKADVFGAAWLKKYSESVSTANDYMTDVVVGAVDFRCRLEGSDKNRERCPALPWWVEMKGRLRSVGVAVRVPVVVASVQKSIDWLKKSVASSLSSVSKVLGSHWKGFLDDLLFEGGIKMSLERRSETEACDRQQLCY